MADEDVAVDEQTNENDAQEEMTEEEEAAAKLKEAIEVSVEDVGPLRKKLSVTVPREFIDEQLGEQFEELRQEAAVPGFRRGRAPMKLIEKRFGSDVGDEIGSRLLANSYLQAVEKESLDPLGDPLICVTVKDESAAEEGGQRRADTEKLVPINEAVEHLHLPKEGAFEYSCEIEVRPEFELPDLEKIPVERQVVEVTDDDVAREVKRMLDMRGSFRPVEKGSAKEDDLVIGDANLTVDDEVVESEEAAALAVRDQHYAGIKLEGWGKACTGKNVGDEVTLPVTLPDDFEKINLRGKKGSFTLTINELKRFEAPQLDKELITSLGFESESELRDYLRDSLELRSKQSARQQMREQVEKYLLDNAKFDVPEGVSRRQTERIVGSRMVELYRMGMPESEISKHVDELRMKAAETARDQLRLSFVLDKIATDREVEVREDEVNAAIGAIAARRNRRFDRVRDELVRHDQMTSLYLRLRDEKVLDMLLDAAEVTEAKAPKKTAKPESKPAKGKKDTSKSTDADK